MTSIIQLRGRLNQEIKHTANDSHRVGLIATVAIYKKTMKALKVDCFHT